MEEGIADYVWAVSELAELPGKDKKQAAQDVILSAIDCWRSPGILSCI